MSVKSGLRMALLVSRRFCSVATGTVSTRTMVDPAFGRKMGSRGHFTPSGAQPATWGNMPNVAFYVNVESETCGCCHVIATNAHVRLVSYKAAYIDRWRSEVAQWLPSYLLGRNPTPRSRRSAQSVVVGMSSHVRDMCPCHACMSTLTPCLQVAMGSIWAMRFVCVIDVEARGPATKRCFTRPAAAARLPLDRWDRFLLVTCACGIEPALRARCGAAVWSIMGRQSVS